MSTGISRDDRAAGRVGDDPYASDPARPLASAAGPWWRWLFLVPGLAAVGWGVVGLLGAHELAQHVAKPPQLHEAGADRQIQSQRQGNPDDRLPRPVGELD